MCIKLAVLPLGLFLSASSATVAAQQSSIDAGRWNEAQLPLTFEQNRGQADAHVSFLARGNSYVVFLEGTTAVLMLPPSHRTGHAVQATPSLLKVELLDASSSSVVEGVDRLPGKSNYYIGDRKKWLSGIPQFRKVKMNAVYPSIDLVYYGGAGGLEYDFVLAPGADAARLRFRVTGADKVALNKEGDLCLRLRDNTISLRQPNIYQETNGSRSKVPGAFSLLGKDEIGFNVGSYDHSKTLIVDPVLVYSTLIGSNNNTQVQAIAVGPKGDVFIAGTTFATNYPTVNAFQSTNRGYTDVFVTKLNANGNTILYSTYIGSGSFDDGNAIAVDGNGSAYVTGGAGGPDFPTTPGAFMTTCSSSFCSPGFVSKFRADGSLAYSTFIGNSNGGAAIAVDGAGEAYIAGTAGSNDVPTTPTAFEPTYPGAMCTSCYNAFVQKLNASGSALVYGTYFGLVPGNGIPPSTTGRAIAVDSSGSAYLVGSTTGIPTKNPLQSSAVGGPDAYIAKFSPDGSSLIYATYLGGSQAYFSGEGGDLPTGVAVDTFGNAHMVGTSGSCEFPLTLNAWSTDCANEEYTQKVFVTTLNPSGTHLLFSTFLGSGFSTGIAVDSKGSTYVTGFVSAKDFPLLNPIQGVDINGGPPFGDNSFVTKLNLAGQVLFSTYLGQTGGGAQATAIAVGGDEAMYVAGFAQGDFPILHPIPNEIKQTTNSTVFVAKISQATLPQFSLSPQVSPILTLRNVSSVPLTISSIMASANFTKGGDCEKTLAPATACTLLLIGKADKTISGTVTITSDATPRPKTLTIYKSPYGDSVGANFTYSPSLYAQFPPQLIRSTSGPKQIVITNAGPLPAAINSIFMIQPSAFTEINDCPGLLEPFSSCTITITYTAATGSDYAQIGILRDPNQSRDTLFLSGTASNSAIVASTPTVEFGTQLVGAKPLSRIVNFINTSTYPAQITGISTSKGFGQTNTCSAPLPPQGECRAAVWYVPRTNESPTGQLTASNLGPGGPQAIPLYATGVIPTDLSASPLPLSVYAFVGQSNAGYVTLTNTSAVAMTITSFKVGGPFTQSNDCNGGLAAGASCTLTVNFAPTQDNTSTGSVTITHSGVGSPQIEPVIGNPIPSFYLDPASWNYGQVPVQAPTLGYIGLSNNSGASITIDRIKVTGTDFKLTKNGCPNVLPPHIGCADVEITFTPSAIGTRNGTATVTVSGIPTPFTAPLQGVGISAGIGTLSSTAVSFSQQAVGTTSAPQTLVLTNTGTGVLTLGPIAASTQFTTTNNCPATLAANASCNVYVSFAPTFVGILEGTLTLQDDGSGSPHTASLSGIGQ